MIEEIHKEKLEAELNLSRNEKELSLKGKMKKTIFEVLIILLNDSDISLWVDSILIYTELLQWIGFPLHPAFGYIFKKENILQKINVFINYFQITVYFTDNGELFVFCFYLCILIVILMVVNLIYVIISVLRKKFSWVWPLRTLRSIASIIVTILFMPIFEVFIAMLQCEDNGEGISVLSYYKELQCWNGSHIVHVIFAIVFSILFVAICAIIQLCYFESRFLINDHNAKRHARADTFLIFAKIIAILLMYYFFLIRELHWVVIIINWIIAFYMFYLYYAYHPYYNPNSNKIRVISNGIYLWANTVLVVGKILENTDFNSCIELVFIGSIFVIIYIAFYKTNRLKSLMINIKSVNDEETVIRQIYNILALIQLKDTDREAKEQLIGYICATLAINEDNKFVYLKNYIEAQKMNNEINSYLYQHVKYLYQEALYHYPNSTELRISYAYFLQDTVKNKKLAMEQLQIASLFNPYFDEQYTIYRCMKLIEDSLSQENASLDLISNIAYINYLNQFKHGIKKITNLYLEFWNTLLNSNHEEGTNNLSKLNELGTKINYVIPNEVVLNFKKIKEIKQIDIYSIKLYSEFLLQILNDKEKSNELKKVLEDINSNYYEQQVIINSNNERQIGMNSNIEDENILIVSADNDNIGTILNVSLGICTIFGYTKKELINSKIEIILPNILSEAHTKLIYQRAYDYKNMLNENLGSIEKIKFDIMHNTTYGIDKENYMIDIKIIVNIAYSSLYSGFCYFCVINKVENIVTINKSCKVYVDNLLFIQNFSLNCIKMLEFNKKDIINKNVNICNYIAEFETEGIKSLIPNQTNKNEFIYNDNRIEDISNKLLKNYSEYNNIRFMIYKYSSNNNNTFNINSFDESKLSCNLRTINYNNNKNYNNKITDLSTKCERFDLFKLKVESVVIDNAIYGYIFNFELNINDAFKGSQTMLKPILINLNDEFIPQTKPSIMFVIKNNKYKKVINLEQDQKLLNYKYNIKKLAYNKIKKVKEIQHKQNKKLIVNTEEYEESNNSDIELCNSSLSNLSNNTKEDNYVKNFQENNLCNDNNEDFNKLNSLNNIKFDNVKDNNLNNIECAQKTINNNNMIAKRRSTFVSNVYSINKDTNNADKNRFFSMIEDYLKDYTYTDINTFSVKQYKYSYEYNKIIETNNSNKKVILSNSKLIQNIIQSYNLFINLNNYSKSLKNKLNDEKFVDKNKPSTSKLYKNRFSNFNINNNKLSKKLISKNNLIDIEGKVNTEINQYNNNNNQYLIKQIELSLTKQENQISVKYLKVFSYIAFTISVVLMCILFLLMLIYSYKPLYKSIKLNSILQNYYLNIKLFKENVSNIIIYNLFTSNSNTAKSNASSNNVLLLNDFNDNKFINYLNNNTKKLFDDNNSYLNDYKSNYINLFNDADYLSLYTSYNFISNILRQNSQLNSEFLVPIEEFLNNINYHINKISFYDIESNIDYSYNNNDLINFLYYLYNNTFKPLEYILSKSNILVFDHLHNFIKIIVILLGIILVDFLLTLIVLNKMYIKVEMRKESYLEVFLEIGNKTIIKSINKCEEFNKKYCSDEINENKSIDFNNFDSTDDNIFKVNTNSSNNVSNIGNFNKKNKKYSSNKNYGVKCLLAIPLLITFIILLFISLSTYLFIDFQIKKYNKYNSLKYQSRYIIDTYGLLKESLNLNSNYTYTANNSLLNYNINYYNNTDIIKVLDSKLSNYFNIKKNIDLEIESNKAFINIYESFSTNYLNIYFKDSCYLKKEVISNLLINNSTNNNMSKNNINCLFIEYDSINDSGLNILITKFKENTEAVIKNKEEANQKYKYNLNELRLAYKKIILSKHIKSNNMILYFAIYPSLEYLCGILLSELESLNKFTELWLIISVIIINIIFIFVFFNSWRKFVDNLNNTIYKTKNMLFIIPKEVLASLKTIPKLLDIKEVKNLRVITKK